MALKFEGSYLNRYEQAHDLYQDNPFFNQEDWDTMSRRGDLDLYASILHDSDKLPSYDTLQKEYRMDLMDTSTRFTILANELYGDKTNTDTVRKEDVYDEQGNVTGTNEYKMSDYDYTKKLLKEKSDALVQAEARRIAQQQKEENSNFFTNFVGGLGELAIGAMEFIDDIFSLAEGVTDGFVALANGGSFDEAFRNAFNTGEGGSADWRIFDNAGWTDAIIQWNIDNTDIRDLDGNFNSNLAGVWGQLTRMVGQYALPMGVGKIAGGLGASAKVASGMSQGLYYTGLSVANLREYASNPAYASVPTWAIVTNAAAKGAVEYLVQRGLNKVLGPSTLDSLIFGLKGSAVKGATKISTWGALKKIGFDAFHEGIEEMFQQYGDWIVDQAFAIKYTDFKYATDVSAETIVMSFVLGALGSIGASSLSVAASGTADFISWRKGKAQITRNLFKSWSFKQTMQNMAQQYDTVVNNPNVDVDTKRSVMGQMYVNYRAIASLYSAIGQDKFNQAVELLERISNEPELSDVAMTMFAKDLMQQVQTMPQQYAQKVVEEVIKNAHMQEPIGEITADTEVADLSDDVKAAAVQIAKDIIAKDKDVKKVVYVDKGATAIKVGDTVLAPVNMTETFDADGILKSAAESAMVMNILNAPVLEVAIDNITDLYKQVYKLREDTTADHSEEIAKLEQDITTAQKEFDDFVQANSDIGTYMEWKEMPPSNERTEFELEQMAFGIIQGDVTDAEYKNAKLHVYNEANSSTKNIYDNNPDLLEYKINVYIAEQRLHNFQDNNINRINSYNVKRNDITARQKQLENIKNANEDTTAKHDVESSPNYKVIAVYNALFNPEFRAIIWGVANQDLYKFMSNLNETITAARKGTKGDAKLTQRVKKVLAEMQRELIIYCINQTNADFDSLTILTPEMKQYIHDNRWNKDMFMRVLNSNGTKTDLDALRSRVNAAPINEQRKQDILIKINSNKKNVRLSGLRELDTVYNHAWTSPYDGTKYLPNNSIPNNMMNIFMQELGLDLQSIMYAPPENTPIYEQIQYDKGTVDQETTLSFYRDQFQMFTNNGYDFTVIDGHIVVVELDKEKQFGYGTFDENVTSIYSGQYRSDRQSFVKTANVARNLIAPYLNPKLDNVSRANIKVSDAIYDPSKLSKNTLESILKKYGKVTPQTTFLYLRDMFLDKSNGGTSIVMRDDGTFTFVDVQNMKNVLSKQNLTAKDLANGEYKLSKFIKKEFLEGRLKDTKVVIGGNLGYYDSDTNTIYIPDDSLDMKQFTLLHEFQHAIQTEEGLLGGITVNWLSSSNISKSLKQKIVSDIAKHRPELFKGIPKERHQTIAEQFVYDTTGEAYAYGMGGEWDVIDFYPTLVKDRGNGTLQVVLPWGSTYNLTYNFTTKQSIVSRDVKTALSTNEYTADDGTKFRLVATSAKNYQGGGGFVLEDGTLYSAPNGVGDVHGPVQKKVNIDFGVGNIVTVHFFDKSLTKSGFPEYFIDVNSKMQKAQYMETAELITELQNRGYIVTVAKIDGDHRTERIDDFQYDGYGILQELNIKQESYYNPQLMANDNKKRLLDYPVYREINEWYKEAMPDREMQPNSLCGMILPDGTIAYTSKYWTHLEVERAAATHFAPEGKDVKIDKFVKHSVEIALNGRFGNGFQDSVSIRINGSMNIDMQESLTNLIDEALMHHANLEIEHRPTAVYITADESMSGRQVMNELRRYVNAARGKTTNVPVDRVSTKTESVKEKAEVVTETAKPVEQPKVEEPKVEEPKVEEPKIEQPKVEQPELEEPKVEKPKVKEPKKKDVKDYDVKELAPDESKKQTRPKRQNTKYLSKEEAGQNKHGQTVYKYKYEHNTYVSNADAQKTNLKYFIRKNRPIQMGQDMQYFVINANKYNVPEDLWTKIEKGTLVRQDIMDYWRTTDSMDRNTFELINEAFFHNDYAKSYKQVLNFTEGTAMADYYALRAIMRKVGLAEEAMWSLSKDAIVAITKDWLKIPDIKRLYDSIRLRYSSYKGQPIEINRNAARITFMKYYDGSVNSLAKIASIVKYIAVNGWDVAGEVKTTAGDKKAQTKRHQEDLDFTIEESTADVTAEEAFDAIGDKLEASERKAIQQEILNYYAEQVRSQGIKLSKEAMIQAVKNLTDEQLRDFYTKLEISDITARKLSKDEMQRELEGEAKPIVKPRKNLLQSLYQTSASIRNNLSPNEKKKFLEAHGDMFTEDIKVKPELYKDKPYEEVEALRAELKKISTDVRAGKYESQTTAKILKSLEYWRKRAKSKTVQQYRDQAKGKANYKTEQTLKFSELEYTIDSTAEIPVPLKHMLDTTFETFAKTNVQYLTGEGEVHIKMQLQKFQDANIQRFMQLTEQDVTDIINYYQHALLVGKVSEEAIRKFNAVKIYVLGYLHRLGTDGDIHVTAEQLTQIDELLRATATGAGTDLAVFRSVLKVLNPNKALIQSIARTAGIDFREEDVEGVTKAIKTGDVKQIEKAMTKMYENGLKLYTGSKKSFLDKLWKFQRMAMLSSPGTWIRNIVSNTLVSVGNNVGTVLGNLFVKKHRAGQYKLTGKDVIKLRSERVGKEWRYFGKVVVDNKVARFIKDNIIDNGLMSLTTEGLNKYDIRKMDKTKQTGADILTDLIVNTVTTKIFNQNQFDTKFMNNVGKALFAVLSDDPWINRRTISYLGKMLQEDGIDLSKGLTEEVMQAYAEAYTLAAWDYMHKPNFFTSIEQGIRQRTGDAGYFLWKQIMPFATAGWNWFIEGLNYTPIGLARGIIQFARLENTIDKMDTARRKGDQMPSSRFAEYLAKRTIGKGIIGTIGLIAGIALGAFGVIGVDEDDDKLKLKVGDLYIDISDLFGTSSILIGAAITNPWKNSDASWSEKFWDCIAQTLDQLFMESTFSDLFNEFEYSDTFADWLLEQPMSWANTFVPNILKTFNGLLYNHKIKYSSGIMYGLESFVIQAIPGVAYAFPKKVDPYTGELKQKYNVPFIFDFVNRLGPVDFKPYSVSDVQEEAIAQGVQKTELTGKYKDIGELSNKDKQLLNTIYGQLNNQDLKKLYNNQIVVRVKDANGKYVELRYSQMTSEQKKSAIESIMTDNAKLAKIFVYTNNGGKYYATSTEYSELRAAGIVKNVFKETSKLKGFN